MIRTLENCSLIQKCVRKGIGEPEQRNGVCLGYQKAKTMMNLARNVNLANSIFPMRKAVIKWRT